VLVDTSVLLRLLQRRHPHYELAAHAVESLPRAGTVLHIVAQNLIELWAVATRPADHNGLDLSPEAGGRRTGSA
jgi:predicted nucleic acid-binding protein